MVNFGLFTFFYFLNKRMSCNRLKLNADKTAYQYGRPHIGANGASWLPLEKWMKN